MGAWGPGTFENDEALELADEVCGGGGGEALEGALARVLALGDDYLEAPEAAQGLAAASIVSRLRGRNIPSDSGVAELEHWLENVDFFIGPATVEDARAAVSRVMQKPSELLELWAESGSLDAGWMAGISLLLRRLE